MYNLVQTKTRDLGTISCLRSLSPDILFRGLYFDMRRTKGGLHQHQN